MGAELLLVQECASLFETHEGDWQTRLQDGDDFLCIRMNARGWGGYGLACCYTHTRTLTHWKYMKTTKNYEDLLLPAYD